MSKSLRSCLIGAALSGSIVFAYYYFFTERLPWFWYDDVERLKDAQGIPAFTYLRHIFDFTSGAYAQERPVQQLFFKWCSLFFGDSAHGPRMVKAVLFCLALLVLFALQIVNKVSTVAAAVGIVVAATAPSTFLGTAWVGDAASLELLFLACAFAAFLHLTEVYEGKVSGRFVAVSILLILLVILADRAKAPAKVIPVVFFGYLALTRSRQACLYVVAAAALLAVIPYGAFLSAGGVPGAGAAVSARYHWPLALTFLQQGWVLLMAGVAVAILAGKRELVQNRYLLFLISWLLCELLFFVFYPSAELRYLFTATMALTTLVTALISFALGGASPGTRRSAALAVTGLAALYFITVNTVWNDHFRGSFGGQFVLADKKMHHLNESYRNAFAFYNSYTPFYFALRTSNLYVNVNKRYDSSVSLITRGADDAVSIVNPGQYQAIIALDESVAPPGASPTAVFDSTVPGSLWDGLHRALGTTVITAVSLYDLSPRQPMEYPMQSGVYTLAAGR